MKVRAGHIGTLLLFFTGIKNALEMLEKRFNLDFDQFLKNERERKAQP